MLLHLFKIDMYRKDNEPLYHSFVYSLASHFYPDLSITYNGFIACYIRCKKYMECTFLNMILIIIVTCLSLLIWDTQPKTSTGADR